MVSEVQTDLSSDKRLPVLSLHSRLLVSSLDLISVNGEEEQHPHTHLAYTSDGLSLRTFAANDMLVVAGNPKKGNMHSGMCICCS